MAIKTTCGCGAQFMAKAELAGKRLTCPSRGQPLAIPAAPSMASPGSDPLGLEVTTADPLASGPDPFVGGATPHDPLALGHPEGDLFGDGPAAPVGQFNAASGSPTTVPRPANSGKRRGAESHPYGKEVILEVATGVLAIYHGGSAIYRAIVATVMMVKASTVIVPRTIIDSLGPGMMIFLYQRRAS